MNGVNDDRYNEDSGPFEARYLAFLETISTLRPSLHRYCARMTGSVMDGEDVVQEALFEAYRKLDKFDQSRPLKPWLFRIAHNRCIDFLRRRGVRDEAEDGCRPARSYPGGRTGFRDRQGCRASCGDIASQRTRMRSSEGCLRLLTRRNCGASRFHGWRGQSSTQPRAHKAGGVFSFGEVGSKRQPGAETDHAALCRSL